MASADTELQDCSALQSGVAQDDGSTGKMAAELAALKRDLAEASAALAAQKATNKGLQIRVAELLKGSFNAAALQETYVQVKQERDTLLASKHQWTTNETCMPILEQSFVRCYVSVCSPALWYGAYILVQHAHFCFTLAERSCTVHSRSV